jgi:hypothetical protein
VELTQRFYEIPRRACRQRCPCAAGPSPCPAAAARRQADLTVPSDIGYCCADLADVVEKVVPGPGGDGVRPPCHSRWPAPDHPQTAETVLAAHNAAGSALAAHVEDNFLLYIWTLATRPVAESGRTVT